MAVELKLNAESRADAGKGASRRLRRAKRVPGIVYGADKDPQMIQVSAFELARLMETEAFYSQIISLVVDGQTQQAVLKDLQRHPYKDIVLHLDFQRVKAGERLHVNVPVHLVNEAKCKGVKAGGTLIRDMTDVAIIALPKDLPEYLEVDVTELDVGETIHLSDLRLPPGVALEAFAHGGEVQDHDLPVVSVAAPRVADEAEEGAGTAGSAGQAEGKREAGGD